MTDQELFSYIDHTLLRPDASLHEIKQLCDEAKQYKTASVCINPCYVEFARKELIDCGVRICTVIGFPLGATATKVKCVEAQKAILDGANECDMVINIGALKSKNFNFVQNDIACVKQTIGKKTLKVIIETCLLTEEEKRIMCEMVCNAGADYIKTSTGFSTSGATFDDIKLFKECVGDRCQIKAAGGIKTRNDMEKFISLGANRLGTSSGVSILTDKPSSISY